MTHDGINPHIFRAYDIRGDADRDLGDATMHRIARAYGTYLRRRDKRRIALCRDCRLSSDRIHAALLEGMLECGLDVLDLGVGPTPLLYFAVHHFALDGGIQITGSHNPAGDNGLKPLCARQSLTGDAIQELRRMAEAEDFIAPEAGRVDVHLNLAHLDRLGHAIVGFLVHPVGLGRPHPPHQVISLAQPPAPPEVGPAQVVQTHDEIHAQLPQQRNRIHAAEFQINHELPAPLSCEPRLDEVAQDVMRLLDQIA